MNDEPQDTLRRMEQRLAQATDAAERLIAEAAKKRPPPAGWQLPPREPHRSREDHAPELELLHAVARLLDELVPQEVVERLLAALRELLSAVRALLDFYLERLRRDAATSADGDRVRDIPIQ